MEKADGCQHISYDSEKFSWTFRVSHFTKYGPSDEEPSADSSSNVNGRSEADAFEGEKELD